ncbi:MAG TPA: hypothetical protein VJ437_13130 [Acidiferrobacterales bacterium]|nr:hypothetical protein [Acidiferrobacterales bacterium]
MARRKTVVLDTGPDDDDEQLPPDDELTQVLGELDAVGGGFVKVERVREGKRAEFVGQLSPAEFSLSLLQERFGGGEYAVTVFDSARRYVKRSTVAVAQPLRPPAAEAPPSAIEKLVEAMQASMKQQQDMLAALVTRSQAPAIAAADPQEMRRGILQDLALMKQLVGGGEGQQLGPDKILEVLRTGMQIAKDAAAGGEVDVMTVLGKAVDVLGEPFADLLRARAVLPAASSGQMDPRRLPVAGAAPAMVKPKQGGSMNMQQAVAFLVSKAAAGADPGLYADLVLDNVPEAMLRPVLAGDVVATLSQIDPRVANHAQWFRDLGAMLSEALRPDDAGTGSTTPAADGNAGGDPVGS